MCSHSWTEINGVFVCLKCGLTKLPDGRVFFDREIANYRPKNKKRGKRWQEK